MQTEEIGLPCMNAANGMPSLGADMTEHLPPDDEG